MLAVELGQTPEGQARFDLLMRLGGLEEQQLERMSTALAYYRDALAIPGPGLERRPSSYAPRPAASRGDRAVLAAPRGRAIGSIRASG